MTASLSLPSYASRGPARFLLHYVRQHWVSHSLIMASVFMAVFCSVGSQYAIKHLVDVLSMRTPPAATLWIAVGILLGLVAGDNFLWRVAGWIASYCYVAVGGDIRLDLFSHLSGHGARYFSDQFAGGLANRITTAATAAWSIENALTWTTIPPGIAVISSIVLLGTIHWQMTAVILVIVLILSLIIGRLAARTHHLHEYYAGEAAAVTGDITDIVSNMRLVRAFGATSREYQRLSTKIGAEMTAQKTSLRSLEKLRLFHAFAVFLVSAGVLVWTVTLWRAHLVTTGDVVLTTTLAFTVLHASRDLAVALVDMVQHFAKLGEAVRVLGVPHEMQDSPNAKPLINLGGSISFQNVSFAYPTGESVLHDFNLHVPAGQKLGLVGKSGAGKSTIIALLQRFYDPMAGVICIDEQPIHNLRQESLQNAISVVQQDIALFHRSVLENLRYGQPDASDEDVYQAAKAASCTEFIERLPDGFNTVVGERGMKLSGGQRQRLAIARAFLRDSPIILLDEATSSLDTESEQAIQEALDRLVQDRTVIAIAHRLSTLRSFDRIVVLERGRIIEDGSPAELLQCNGIYSRMYQRQIAASTTL